MEIFISDLHLCPERPPAVRVFLRFLAGAARDACALYILGDLFEYWVGDDDIDDPFNAEIVAAIAEYSRHTPVSFIAGNRDFLVGEAFARATGVRLLPDIGVHSVDGVATLLMHGDTLCTDDQAYMAFRREARAPAWRANMLGRPLTERKAELAGLRERSEAAKREKPPALMDVNTEAVANAFRQNGYARLVHGHTHRPGHHVVDVDGRACERWVLAEWCDTGQCLIADQGRLRSQIIDI